MDLYSLAFSLSNLGPKSYQKLINKFGDSKKAWGASRSKYHELNIKDKTFETFDKFRKNFDIEEYIGKLEKENVFFVSFFDRDYPKNFKKLENPPIGIFCKGNKKLLSSRNEFGMTIKIAVVGTRKITSYGKNVTETIVSELVNNGACIVSGLALGVDGLSHRVCLENNGLTIAVLACGVDCCLPSENYSLYQEILKQDGLIISEYPLSCPPNKGTFLARNRLIAALSDGVLVAEAAEESGSLVTANWGFKLSKKVFAVPGPINSQMAKGGLKLLKQGAKLVTEGNDILKEFKTHNSKLRTATQKFKLSNLSKDEKRIINLLENEEMTVDAIAVVLKIPVSKLFASLSNMELNRVVKNVNGRWGIIR